MANSDSTKHASDQSHESYADDAKARRVLKVDSTDSDVLEYVRENLNHKTISNPGIKGRHYMIPLVIKKG